MRTTAYLRILGRNKIKSFIILAAEGLSKICFEILRRSNKFLKLLGGDESADI